MPKLALREAYKPEVQHATNDWRAVIRSKDGSVIGTQYLNPLLSDPGRVRIHEWVGIDMTEEFLIKHGEPVHVTVLLDGKEQFVMHVAQMQWRKTIDQMRMIHRYEFELIANWTYGTYEGGGYSGVRDMAARMGGNQSAPPLEHWVIDELIRHAQNPELSKAQAEILMKQFQNEFPTHK